MEEISPNDQAKLREFVATLTASDVDEADEIRSWFAPTRVVLVVTLIVAFLQYYFMDVLVEMYMLPGIQINVIGH